MEFRKKNLFLRLQGFELGAKKGPRVKNNFPEKRPFLSTNNELALEAPRPRTIILSQDCSKMIQILWSISSFERWADAAVHRLGLVGPKNDAVYMNGVYMRQLHH